MSPKPKIVPRSVPRPVPRAVPRGRPRLLALLIVLVACGAAACGGADNGGPDAALCVPPPGNTAPTYTQLFTRYFAPGTPGHCANDGCHNGNFNIWKCGFTKDSCFQGMATMAGLIDTRNPTASTIGDPRNSPLSWINPNGPMPFDTPGPFPEGRDAILAWVAACAQNN